MSGARKPALDWSPRAGPGVERAADRIADRLLGTSNDPMPVTTREAGAVPAARGGTPLPRGTLDYFEPRLGRTLRDVRVHSDAGAAAAARAIGARAFVQGNAIYFDRGEYAPESSAGRALLAHEIAHVAQIGMGTASATALHPAPAPTVAKPNADTIQSRLLALMCLRADTRAIVARIKADGVRILLFETAFDKWRYDDGHEEENELKGLQGNTRTDLKTIRLRQSLDPDDMMMTLFHEMQHWQHSQDPTGPRGLDSEIEARVATEQLAIDRGKPETRKGYRTADGKPNRAAITRDMQGSPHYSPTGRTRIGRRYVNETPVTGDWSCPIGDFPDPGKFRNYA